MASRRKRKAAEAPWVPTKKWLGDIARTATLALSRTEVDKDGCWLWLGAMGGPADRQRPQLTFHGRTVYVARVILAAKLGRPLRRGMLATHSCDKGRCIHPKCLTEGTYSQNNTDSWSRLKRPKLLSEGEPL